jgi:hypothetical protein
MDRYARLAYDGPFRSEDLRNLLAYALALGIAATSAACSKKNTIDASADIISGVPCSAAGDPACGKDGACVLGYCRIPCDHDYDCPEGALCIGTPALSGCQLSWDMICNMSQHCNPGLTCGTDHKCRMPCTVAADCPRADQECVQGACVGNSEPGAGDASTD